MADAFLSHSHHDREMAQRIHDALVARKKDVWADWEDVPPASRFQRDLDDGVAGSHAFVFLISPDSVSSKYCLEELQKATDLNKRIVPVVHEPVDHDAMPTALAERSWIPLEGCVGDDFDGCLERVVKAIETDLDWTREHTYWGNHALDWDGNRRDRSLLLRGDELERAEEWLSRSEGRSPAPTALQREYVRESREYDTRSRRVRIGAGGAALALLLVLGIVTIVIASNQSSKNTKIAYIRSVESIINDSKRSLDKVQAIYSELADRAAGKKKGLSPPSELESGIATVTRGRTRQREHARALGAPSATARRMRASLVDLFTLKLANIREIRRCVTLSLAPGPLAECLKGTKDTSDAATRAKNSRFLPLFNRLRRDAGLAPTAPDLPF